MKTIATTSFQEFTSLPVKEVVRADSVAKAISVETPMGVQVINYQETAHSMFGANRTIEVEADKIIRKLSALERESKELLLNNWLEELKK